MNGAVVTVAKKGGFDYTGRRELEPYPRIEGEQPTTTKRDGGSQKPYRSYSMLPLHTSKVFWSVEWTPAANKPQQAPLETELIFHAL